MNLVSFAPGKVQTSVEFINLQTPHPQPSPNGSQWDRVAEGRVRGQEPTELLPPSAAMRSLATSSLRGTKVLYNASVLSLHRITPLRVRPRKGVPYEFKFSPIRLPRL